MGFCRLIACAIAFYAIIIVYANVIVPKSHELVPIISRCPMIATEIQSKLSEGSTDDEKSGETETQSQVAILKKQNEIQ